MQPTKIRVTKQFRFEAAHALWGYDGVCKNIHGHSYILYVTLIGIPNNDKNHPKYGMVMDFGVVKELVNHCIINQFDHALMVNKSSPHKKIIQDFELIGKVLELDYQPTCENMVADFANRIIPKLPKEINLHSLRLHETATAYAEWYAEDNI